MERTDWFRAATYGLFIHWGLYAIPGGEWRGEAIPCGSEWIMKNARIPLAEYRRLAERFCPAQFDARALVRAAKRWGMRYLCVTAKHHDGFAMFDTAVSDWSVMHTPYGRDVVRDLANACAEEGMPFCVYYSQMQDWEDPNGHGNDWDYDPTKKDFRTYFYGKVLPQVRELLTNYGRIAMIWFDTPYDMPQALCRELRETVLACQPDCLINGRIGYGLGDYAQAADNSIPTLARQCAWETPMTLNSSWGYMKRDTAYRSPEEVIDRLVQIAGKGGNLLLNVGPDADGCVPAGETEVLERVGEWLARFGESVFDTAAAPDMPYLIRWGHLTYCPSRRCLYFHVREYPTIAQRVLLTGLRTPVRAVTLLSDGRALKWSQSYEPARNEHRFYVFLPPECAEEFDTVIAVELEGEALAQSLDEL